MYKIAKIIPTFLSVMVIGQTMAADIAHSIRNNTQDYSSAENYLELGVYMYSRLAASAGATNLSSSTGENTKNSTGSGLLINGSYSFYNAFVEKYGESDDPILLGYSAFNNENWSFDLVMTPKFGELRTDSKYDRLDDREASILFGGRLTGDVFGNTVQLSVKQDISGTSKGTTASAMLGRNWQIRNWNIHGLVGTNYIDDKMSNYYNGISQAEADRTEFNAYESNHHFSYIFEAGVTYPLTQDWVFRITGRTETISKEVSNSPIVSDEVDDGLQLNNRQNATSLTISLSYVF